MTSKCATNRKVGHGTKSFLPSKTAFSSAFNVLFFLLFFFFALVLKASTVDFNDND